MKRLYVITQRRGAALGAIGLLLIASYAWRLLAGEPELRGQVKSGRGRCVALTSQRLSQSVARVYRAFEDGTVEASDDGAGSQGDWVRIGR